MTRIVKPAEERKNEIMNAAEALFARDGFAHVPVARILEVVGIAKGTFYHHFESKEELLHAILERKLEGIASRARMAAGASLPAVRKLQAVLSVLFAPGGPGGVELDASDEKHALMHVKLTSMFFALVEPILAGVTEEGVRNGEFRTGEPADVTQILLRGISGYMSVHYGEMKDPVKARHNLKQVGLVLTRVLGLDDRALGF